MRPNMEFCSRKEGKNEESCKKRRNFDFPACQNSLAMAVSSEVQSKLIHHAKWNTELTHHMFVKGVMSSYRQIKHYSVNNFFEF